MTRPVASLIGIVPDSERLPLHPSPLAPPDAVQAFEFWEAQLNVTALPTASLGALALSVTADDFHSHQD